MTLRLLFSLLVLLSIGCAPGDSTLSQDSASSLTVDLSPRLQKAQGQWVYVNYWAQWCKPCIKEIPELNALDADHGDVTVLGVNYDGVTGAELEQQLTSLNVAFDTLSSDPSEALGIQRPMVLPTTVIIAPSGELHSTLLGPQTLESLLNARELE
ncbi:MAG: TlpA disulfide reductase family protein [Halioglobus sp.]